MNDDRMLSTSTEYPGFEVGTWVSALIDILDDGVVRAKAGAVGHVVEMRRGFYPTIFWERSGGYCDGIPGEEIGALCGPGFAKTPATTPGIGR